MRRVPKRIQNMLMMVVAALVLYQVAAYAITHARQVSQQQVCAANLKTLGEACKMYQENWHDVLVPHGAPFAWPPNGKMWPELIYPYLRQIGEEQGVAGNTGKLFRCPRYVEEEACFCSEPSYGMNERCGGWLPNEKPVVVPLRKVRYPGSTIRIAEVSWKAQGGSRLAAKPSEFIPSNPDACRMFPTRHMGRGNVLWIDGHVSSMTLEQYNLQDDGPYDGNIWLRLQGPKPPVPGERM